MCKGEDDVRTEEDGKEGDGEEEDCTLVHDCCELRDVSASAGSMTEWTKMEMRLNALGQLDAFALRLVAKLQWNPGLGARVHARAQ